MRGIRSPPSWPVNPTRLTVAPSARGADKGADTCPESLSGRRNWGFTLRRHQAAACCPETCSSRIGEAPGMAESAARRHGAGSGSSVIENDCGRCVHGQFRCGHANQNSQPVCNAWTCGWSPRLSYVAASYSSKLGLRARPAAPDRHLSYWCQQQEGAAMSSASAHASVAVAP